MGTSAKIVNRKMDRWVAAQVLYGVTMQEPGVSRLVSVKLKANEAAA